MRIGIVTPAPPGSNRGNRVTAERWRAILQRLGHEIELVEAFADQSLDLLIVLHAGRGADSIRRFREQNTNRPLFVAITGTDIYSSEFNPQTVRRSLELADRIIVLQPRTADDLPPEFRSKVRILFQSAVPPKHPEQPREDIFEIALVGHLRPVKDPFRAAEASRLLDAASTIQILQLGEALSPEMADRARREQAENARYQWLGDLPHEQAMSIMSRCKLVALTSLSEGGPAVIAEAIVAGVPVVSTRVAGCVGMLGDDYPGLFPPGDTQALAELFARAERDADYYQSLRVACDRRRPLFAPEAEESGWRLLLVECLCLSSTHRPGGNP